MIWAVKFPKSKFTFNHKTAKELNKDNVSEQEYLQGIRKQMGSVWRIAVCSGRERLKDEKGNKLHSTQKPEELLYRIINICSNPNDLVLDPFGGTFTTGAIAKRCARSFIGIEKDKKYCEYGKHRIEQTKQSTGSIETAEYDIKPTKVSLKDMIENKFLFVKEPLFIKLTDLQVQLLDYGRVVMPDGKITNIHQAAAEITNKKATRVNGFDYWYADRDGQRKSINDIREDYRKFVSK